MGSSLQLANFGDAYSQRSPQAMETNQYVLEAIKKCLLEIERNFPSTTEKPSSFMCDEAIIMQLFEHLDHHYMVPNVDGPPEVDRLQLLAGSAIQLLSSMNMNMAFKYLEIVLKSSHKFHSLVIVGYFKVTTKDLSALLKLLNCSPAVGHDRQCKALCKGLHKCILDWCKHHNDDFLELWLRSNEQHIHNEIRDGAVLLFCKIGELVSKLKRRCALWPCMGALLRLCSTRIKYSHEMFGSMKRGIFGTFGSDDDCAKFCRRFDKLCNELNLSAFSNPEQKSMFLVSLYVLRDTLEAITLLSTHSRSPFLVSEADSPCTLQFKEDVEQLWKCVGTSSVSGVKTSNIHICCDLLLDQQKPWASEFNSKGELAFPIGVIDKKDLKKSIAVLAYDVMLSASQLKNAPNTPLQARNPFNILKFWEGLVEQKSRNHYFTLFTIRVIRAVVLECASRFQQGNELLSSAGTALHSGPNKSVSSATDTQISPSRFAIGHDALVSQQRIMYPPGSPIIDSAVKTMDCTIKELSMYLIDVLRQSIVAHHDIIAAAADGKPRPADERMIKSVISYWGKQVLLVLSEAPHLAFIPISAGNVASIGWSPQAAKQVFRAERAYTFSYKAMLSSLETGAAKWLGNRPYCVLFTVLMCFESFDLMLSDQSRHEKDSERDAERERRSHQSNEVIASIFSVQILPLYYPEAPLEGILAVFGVICAAVSEQILAFIKERQPYCFAQNGLSLLTHCCQQLLLYLTQHGCSLNFDSPNLAAFKPRLSHESSSVEWIGHRVEFMVFVAACEVNPSLLRQLYSLIGYFCDVLAFFHSSDHPHFVLFRSLALSEVDATSSEVQSGMILTHRIHDSLRNATFQVARSSFSQTLWTYLFSIWSSNVQQLMATDKQQRSILSDDGNRLESYASFLLLLSRPLCALENTKETGKIRQVVNVFFEFFNKMLVEFIDDFGVQGKLDKDKKVDDSLILFSRQFFKSFLSESFPSMFCEELFSCMVDYSKECTKDLQKLCRKYNEDSIELQAKYCLPLYCDILLAVLSSLSESLSQKCLKDLKQISLITVCTWANNSDSKANPDVFIQRLQHICQVVSAMAKVRSLLPFANEYGFWSLWLQQTYDWAVRLSNEQSSSSRVEIFNAINLLLQVVPENKLEEKDARASDKKYLKFILNELEKQTASSKMSVSSKPGTFINEDFQDPLMEGLAAVIKKSKYSVGLDRCLEFVSDFRLQDVSKKQDSTEIDFFSVSFTKCVFSLKVLQKSLQLVRKDSRSSSTHNEAAALQLKFAPVFNAIFEPPHFIIVHSASKVADASESDMLSVILTKAAFARDQVCAKLTAALNEITDYFFPDC
jgi:hypothetical protein